MLTRDYINSGEYVSDLLRSGGDGAWPISRIERSMRETLQAKCLEGPVWIFGYGSLIWNPLLEYTQRRVAVLQGWRRRFCIKLETGRGSRTQPGRMLGLVEGGHTDGVAYQLCASTMLEDLRTVWIREMIHGLYVPTWSEIEFDDGTSASALIFVADANHPSFVEESSIQSQVAEMSLASGSLGSNAEYVQLLEKSLRADRIKDEYVSAVAQELAEGNPGAA